MTEASDDSQKRLNDIPDWIYLLREFYEIYRFLSSGGSNQIRAHQRAVREAISRVMSSNRPLVPGTGIKKPVTGHLRRALDEGRVERHSNIIRAIEAVQASIDWQYGYEKVPRGLKDKYAYAELWAVWTGDLRRGDLGACSICARLHLSLACP